MEFILHKTNRSAATTGETFDKFDAETAVLTDSKGMVVPHAGSVDPGGLTEVVEQLVAASHSAGERPTDPNVNFARSFLPESGIEGNHFKDLDGFKPQFGGSPGDRVLGEKPKMPLQDMEHGQNRTAPAHRIMGDALVDFLLDVGWNGKRHG